MGIQTAAEFKQRGFGFSSLIWVSNLWYRFPHFHFLLYLTGIFMFIYICIFLKVFPFPHSCFNLKSAFQKGLARGQHTLKLKKNIPYDKSALLTIKPL